MSSVPPEPTERRCADHPERAATGTCARCGSFACADCFVPERGRCARCRGDGAIPWEAPGGRGLSLARTSLALLRRPAASLAAAAPTGALTRSLSFGALCVALTVIAGPLSTAAFASTRLVRLAAAGALDDGSLAILRALLTIGLVFAPLVAASIGLWWGIRVSLFAMLARVAGADGALRSSAWLHGYLLFGLAPLAAYRAAQAFLAADPRLSAVAMIAAMGATEVWVAVQQRAFAESAMGLSRRAASAIAWGPTLLLLAAAWFTVF